MRITFLDGLRGWAALVVLITHFIAAFVLQFYPNYHNPLHLFFSGHSAVYLFFMLSGFSLSSHFFLYSDFRKLLKLFIFRYFRLSIPILFSTLFTFLIISCGLIFNEENPALAYFFKFDISLKEVLSFSFIDSILVKKDFYSYNPALWSIPIEFYASQVIFFFLSLNLKKRGRICGYIVSFFFILFYFKAWPWMYCNFIMGVIFSDIYCKTNFFLSNKAKKIYFFLSLCSIGFFFLSRKAMFFTHDFYRFVIVTFFFLGVISFPALQRIFSGKISSFLGRISFSLYILHAVILSSFSSLLFSYGKTNFSSIPMTIFFCFVMTLLFIFVISFLFSFFIEEKLISFVKYNIFYKLADFLFNNFSKKNLHEK